MSGAFEQEMEIDSSRKRQKKTWHKGVCVCHDVLSLRNVAYCINLPVVIDACTRHLARRNRIKSIEHTF